jgi:maltose alpha-D-glucosyltransferase/alpha-amylase
VKSSPLRDVAGLLRSFDYAAAAALNAHTSVSPHIDERWHDLLRRFTKVVSEEFLRTYEAALEEAPRKWLQPGLENPLLTLFLIEKAAYEICYEAQNRPSWLAFPLRGLNALLERNLENELEPDRA